MLKYKNSVIKIINSSVVDLPTPSSISYFWNFGSLLGVCLAIQLITGIFLAMHYTSHIQNSFDSIKVSQSKADNTSITYYWNCGWKED